MTDPELKARIEAIAPLAEAICSTLDREVARLGFPAGRVAIASHSEARYRLERDPSNGQHSLVGVWRDAQGNKRGELLFHADGSFFAEHDVVLVHPLRPRWFVEAVTAWGRDSLIKAEPRLLPVAG